MKFFLWIWNENLFCHLKIKKNYFLKLKKWNGKKYSFLIVKDKEEKRNSYFLKVVIFILSLKFEGNFFICWEFLIWGRSKFQKKEDWVEKMTLPIYSAKDKSLFPKQYGGSPLISFFRLQVCLGPFVKLWGSWMNSRIQKWKGREKESFSEGNWAIRSLEKTWKWRGFI